VPVFGGVVLDLRALEGIADVNGRSLVVDVRAGTFLDTFEERLRTEHEMTLGHWPQSMALATVGGALACRGAGQYSTRYGKIEDMVVGLEVALADGRLIRTGSRAPRAAVGPDLTQLFVGSEGTLGVITEARVRTHPCPSDSRRAAFAFADFDTGLEACRRILRRGATPAVLRLYDEVESHRSFAVDEAAVLIVMDEGDPALIDAVMGVVAAECGGAAALDEEAHHLVGRWLEHRMALPPLEELTRAGIVADTIEVAGPWTALPSIYHEALGSLTDIEGTLAASAHQSHAYADGGCLYFTFAGRPPTRDPGSAASRPDVAVSRSRAGPAAPEVRRWAAAEAYYRAAWDAVTAAAIKAGGAISHHHGIGLNRGRYMREYLGATFDVLAALKSTLDPGGVLNPGKLGLPSPFGDPPWA
jgi:alkyldihydroxyacetonephosphate synthase